MAQKKILATRDGHGLNACAMHAMKTHPPVLGGNTLLSRRRQQPPQCLARDHSRGPDDQVYAAWQRHGHSAEAQTTERGPIDERRVADADTQTACGGLYPAHVVTSPERGQQALRISRLRRHHRSGRARRA